MKNSDKNKLRNTLTKSDDNKLTHCQKSDILGIHLLVRYSQNVSDTCVVPPRNILNPTFGKEINK